MATVRNSKPKQLISEALTALDHPAANEVYDYVRRLHPKISLGTVYRNLSQMAEGGEIMRLPFPDAGDRFDCNTREHYHVVCERCGRIFDTQAIPGELLEKLNRVVEKSTGVRVKSHTLMFSGVCAQCAQTGTAV